MTDSPVAVPQEVLAEIRKLYEDGLYLQAYERSKEFGPLAEWTETNSRIMAGRLAGHLGGQRVSRLQSIRAWQQSPEHLEATYYFGYRVLERRGPWAARQFLNEFTGGLDESPDILSSWYAFHATVASTMRDFETADKWVQKAAEAAPDSVWVQAVRCQLLEAEDRYEEALEQADKALEMKAWFRPAAQSKAHLLWLLGHDEKALEYLAEASERIESAALTQQLLIQQLEREDYGGAEKSLERMLTLAPMLDKNALKHVASARAEIAYFRNEFDEVVEWAQKADSKFCDYVADRLVKPEYRVAERNTLEMPFVRQHHLTCVPATLTSIARYWGREVDHLELAEKICYAGTSALNERRWSESNGWTVRDFTVTEESVKALIDADIPCMLTTVFPGNAHMQAISGYDARRGTFVILDPFVRTSEAIAEKLLENQAAFGPRGVAMVPQEHVERLASIDLPDSDLWDLLHELDDALDQHRRDDAIVVLSELEEKNPTHRLALDAKRRLAIYDANPQTMLSAVDALLEKYPDNETLHLQRLSLLRNQSRRSDQLEAYEKLYSKQDCHPLIVRDFAEELRLDRSQIERAEYYLKRVLRQTPTDGQSYNAMARLRWELYEDDRENSLEMLRVAACLSEHDEELSESYRIAAQQLGNAEAALDFLRKRYDRFGHKSGQPAQTLCQAYRRLNRHSEAMSVIRQAVELRPEDGELLLYAADLLASAGTTYFEEAKSYLDRAKRWSSRAGWLRTSAFVAALQGELEAALDAWQEVVASQPLAADAHASVTRLLAETQDIEAALRHLNEVADRFPFHIPLQELRISWLRSEAPEEAEACLRKTLDRMPVNEWLIREMAFLLIEKNEQEEVPGLIERAAAIDDRCPAHQHLVAAFHIKRGEPNLARDAYRQTLRQCVDNSHALAELMEACQTTDERREELKFVAEELSRQVTDGEGLIVFRSLARNTLDADELLALLKDAHSERPDLWQSWSALAIQYSSMDRLDDAHSTIVKATEKFPLISRLWLDRAGISRDRSDFEDENSSLQHAWEVDPFWHPVVDALCDLHERDGNRDEARKLLEQLVRSDPLESRHHSRLASVLWKLDEKEAAVDSVERAVLVDPGNADAWSALQHWSTILDSPDRPVTLARSLTEKRPNEARSWLIVARLLRGPGTVRERHAVLEKVISLNERCLEAHSLHAELLAEEGNIEAARKACAPEAFGNSSPSELKLTLAYLEVEHSGIDKAIEILEAALQDDPGFHNGWLQLADWYRSLDNAEKYLDCARAIVKIDPHDPSSLGYLGEALEATDSKAEAVDLFRRAFTVAPTYEFAAFKLFDLLMEQRKDVSEAADVLDRLAVHVESTPRFEGRRIQLLAAQKDRDASFAALKKLSRSQDDIRWALHSAAAAMREAGWAGDVLNMLEELIREAAVNEEVGAVWAQQYFSDSILSSERKLKELAELGPAGERAVGEFLNIRVEMNRADDALRYVRKNRKWIKQSTELWGTAGYVLAANMKYREVTKWMADWREREGVRAWMLFNLVEGLRARGNDTEARAVGQFSVDLPDAEPAQDFHRLWLAIDDPLRNFEQTAYCVTRISPESLNPGSRFLQTLLVAVFKMSGGFGEPASFTEVRETVHQAIRDYGVFLNREPGHRRMLKKIIKLIAENYSGIGPWLFGLSRFSH